MDYGCWSRGERSAIRWLVEAEEACFRMVYLPVDDETQRARIAHRWATTPEETLPMSEADILHGRAHFSGARHGGAGGPQGRWPAARLGGLAGVGLRPVAVVHVTAAAHDDSPVPGVPALARNDLPD